MEWTGPSQQPTSGNPGDDATLSALAARADLTRPRHWIHYLYVADEASARALAQTLTAAGWEIQRVDRAAGGGTEWAVIAEQHDVIVNHASVAAARAFFESAVCHHPEGEYDGWEASV
jgi:hypothetical protein